MPQVRASLRNLPPVARTVARWTGELASQLLAIATFVAGAILLLAGATPPVDERIAWLDRVLPAGTIDISHFLGSLIGTALLLVARGLQRRLDGAWVAACGLLAAASITSVLHGELGAAALAALVLALLGSSRRHFHRRSSLLHASFSRGWIVAIAGVVLASTWLGFFAYRHVEYDSDLWWQIARDADAPRFLRATVGVVVMLFMVACWRLVGPARRRPQVSAPDDLATVRRIVANATRPDANLAFLGDKSFFFNAERTAFVMYAIRGRTWVVLGDPVGPRDAWPALLHRFCNEVDRHDGWPVFYRLTPDGLPAYLDLGLAVLKMGEEACVDLTTFSLAGGERAGLRYIVNRLSKRQARFELRAPGEAHDLLPRLREISDEWLEERDAGEKSFSMGSFDPAYVSNLPLGLVWEGDTLIAFATVWIARASRTMTVDLMRHTVGAPRGTMEFLFVKLMEAGQRDGFDRFSLGMVPLSGLAARPFAERWHRVGRLVYRLGERFYNFRGLREFKDRFHPEWQPRYIAVPRRVVMPLVINDLTALIGAGPKRVEAT